MIDLDAELLAPVYDEWGVPAVLTDKAGASKPVTVIDRRDDGIEFETVRGGEVSAYECAACVRRSEQPSKPRDFRLVLDGTTYRVLDAVRQGGEWVLQLQETE